MSLDRHSRVRMGMVGGGQGAFIGAAHRMAAALDGQAELVCGAFSRDPDNSRSTGAELGLDPARSYASYEDMFAAEAALPADERMEFVAIVTPNHLHVPVAIAAAQHGFHVLSDKPAGISLAETRELAAVIAQSGVLYGLTHNYTGYPMVNQARALAAAPDFGAVRRVLVEYPQGWLAQPLEETDHKQAGWRSDPAMSGPAGAMADIGTHAHNLAEFITGARMDSVSARLRKHYDARRLDDDGEVSFTLDNGATGVLIASQVCVGEENSLKIRVYGEHRSLEWHQMEPNTLIERRSDGPSLIHRPGTDKPLCDEALAHCRLPSGHPEGYLEAFANLYRHFAAAIRTPAKETLRFVPGIQAAMRGMAFLEGVVASGNDDGAWHDLPAFADDGGTA